MTPDNRQGRNVRRGGDPLALVFVIVVVLMLLLGVGLGVKEWFTQKIHGAKSGSQQTLSGALDDFKRKLMAEIDDFAGMFRETPSAAEKEANRVTEKARRAQAMKEAAEEKRAKRASRPPDSSSQNANQSVPALRKGDPARQYPAINASKGGQVMQVPVNGRWNYDVFFGPAWARTGELRYTTQRHADSGKSVKGGAAANAFTPAIGASMSWAPDGGQVGNWFLGVLEPDHPSHANTRFPGFFVHPVYLPRTLAPGGRVLWEIPWQSGGKGEQVRRFDMRFIGWESIGVAAGQFEAMHLKGKLQYVDNDNIRAEVNYSLWYAPRAQQIVRVLWLGRAPDESGAQIIAELASFALQ